jgi:hypothetical protein
MSKGQIRKRLLWFFCRWLLVGGLVPLSLGIGYGLYTGFIVFKSDTAIGKVVRLEAVPDDDGGVMNYAPVFSFTAENGQTYTVRSGVATNPPGFAEGDAVRILYSRSDPGSAKIDSFWQLWTMTVILASLGLFFSVPGYLLLRYERKRNRETLAATSAVPMFTDSGVNRQA